MNANDDGETPAAPATDAGTSEETRLAIERGDDLPTVAEDGREARQTTDANDDAGDFNPRGDSAASDAAESPNLEQREDSGGFRKKKQSKISTITRNMLKEEEEFLWKSLQTFESESASSTPQQSAENSPQVVYKSDHSPLTVEIRVESNGTDDHSDDDKGKEKSDENEQDEQKGTPVDGASTQQFTEASQAEEPPQAQIVRSPVVSPKSPRRKALTIPRSIEESVVYRDEVVREIITTEKKYISDLTLLVNVFLHPLREHELITDQQSQT